MSRIEKVTLSKPVGKGDGKTTDIELREPTAGDLRGVAMVDVYQMDVSAYDTLLPRITKPTLTKEQIGQMSMSDISELMGEVIGFLEPEKSSKTS